MLIQNYPREQEAKDGKKNKDFFLKTITKSEPYS